MTQMTIAQAATFMKTLREKADLYLEIAADTDYVSKAEAKKMREIIEHFIDCTDTDLENSFDDEQEEN